MNLKNVKMKGLTSSFVLALTCTVCKKECKSYPDWITHLLKSEHQNAARMECKKWDKKMKESVIIAYADFPVITLGRKIVQIFGSLSRGRFVTDFVTWEHRPKVAFIQFESRKKASEVIANGNMSQLKIQGQRIQVKKAIDVMDLEWNEFFPSQQPIISRNFKDSSVQTETVFTSTSNSNLFQKRKSVGIDLNDQGNSSSLEERTSSQKANSKKSKPEKGNTSHVPSSLPTPIVSHEDNLLSSELSSFKNNTSNHFVEEESENITPMQRQKSYASERDHFNAQSDLTGRTEKQAKSMMLLFSEDISNNFEDSAKDQIPKVSILSRKDYPNNSLIITKNGTNLHSPLSSSSSVRPCENKPSSSNPTPKKLTKEEGAYNSDMKNEQGSKNSFPVILESSLEKPQCVNLNKTKMQPLLAADVQTIKTTENSFQIQYKKICDVVMFPDLEYNNVMSIVKSMESCIQKTFPKSNLYVFRNFYLKLKNPGYNKLLLFLDTQGIWEEDWILENNGDISRNGPFVTPDLRKPVQDLWTKLKVLRMYDIGSIEQDFIPELNSFGMKFYHEATNLTLTLVTRQHFILELQTCRLLNYMTAFDSRTVPIMTIVKYWAHINQTIPLLSLNNTDQTALSSLSNQALSLDWLIIVFLSSRRFIPTVRQILERPHKKLIMYEQDIGFDADLTFAKAWTTKRSLPEVNTGEFIKSVLSLVQEFFKFWRQLPSNPFVVNSRDGEIIESKEFSKKFPFCQLSIQELTAIKNTNPEVGKPYVSMLHPLCLRYMLSFDKSTIYGDSTSLIKNTTEKLQKISFYENNGKSYLDLKSLFLI